MLSSFLYIFDECPDLDRQTRDLSAMSDRQLADLGISRDQVDAFVRQRACR